MAQPIVYRGDFEPRSRVFKLWEKQRNRKELHWLIECFAESLGVFFYVYAGVGSQTAWVTGNILVAAKVAPVGLSSIFQVGFAYMGGILLALGICAGTSGGHFNPCVSIAFTIFKGFPPLKALRYIVAQILGAYIACLLVYAQYQVTFQECTAILNAAGKFDALNYTPNGLAGIFGFYLLPGQTLGLAFLNEFVADTFIGLAIWASLDSSNALIPPVMGPILVSLAYGTAIWGFSMPGLVANSARDLGGRFMAMTIWGSKAAGGPYSAIAALANIPAMIFAAFIYEFFLTDSDRVVTRGAYEHGMGHINHRRHMQEAHHNIHGNDSERQTPSDEDDKPTTFTYEHSKTAPR